MKVRDGIEVSMQSDLGCQRANNEDSFGYWEPEDDRLFLRKGRLAVVADGMGGYEGGQEASRLAVETLLAMYRDFGGDDPQQALVMALQAAHEYVRQYSFAHPQRNILTAALGTNPDLIMDSPGHPEPLRAEDVLLICTDGLWGQVRDPEILEAVENKNAEQAGRELIALARERGGPDNITVEILRLR